MIKHRFVCFFVSLFVRLVDIVWATFGFGPRVKCVVLNYHGVKAEERRRFSEQMDALLRLAKPIPADAKVLPAESGNYAVVTFDDALEGVLDNAIPELETRQIPATIFVVVETIGKYAEWKDMGAADAAGQKSMSLEQLKALPPELITLGSHSMTHPLLSSVCPQELREEVLGSRTRLEELLSRNIHLFSCPYGVCDSRTVESCREAGYARVFTGLADLALLEPNEFVTGRVRTTLQDTQLEFRLKLQGAYRWLPAVIHWKSKLKSVFHKQNKLSGTPITATNRKTSKELSVAHPGQSKYSRTSLNADGKH
jgi:peptidoglycan/xylan/chitin deacetylase (PgdA/CDA1 family)